MILSQIYRFVLSFSLTLTLTLTLALTHVLMKKISEEHAYRGR